MSRGKAERLAKIPSLRFDRGLREGWLPPPEVSMDDLELWSLSRVKRAYRRYLAQQDSEALTVYVVGFDNYVKIGFSLNRDERLKNLQTGIPKPLITYATLPGDLTLEKRLHFIFEEQRMLGEWFKREGLLAEWIEQHCNLSFLKDRGYGHFL